MTELDIAYQLFLDDLPSNAGGVIPKYKFSQMVYNDYPIFYEYVIKARNKIREDKLNRILKQQNNL